MNEKKIIKKLIERIRDIREEYTELENKYDEKLVKIDNLQYDLNMKSDELEDFKDLQDKYDDLIYDHKVLEEKISDLEIELDNVRYDRDHYENLAREHLSEHFI